MNNDETNPKKINTLISWMGSTDLKCCIGEYKNQQKVGPIISIFNDYNVDFRQLILLYDKRRKHYKDFFISYLKSFNPHKYIQIHVKQVDFKNLHDYESFYKASREVIKSCNYDKYKYYINTSSGAPMMSSSWFVVLEHLKIPKQNEPILLSTGMENGTSVIDFKKLRKKAS